MTAVKTYVTFKSSAFNTTEPREYFINPCCFGDDVAKWLIQEMQKRGVEVDQEPGQEDFGWYISFCISGQRYNFILGYGADEEEWTGWLERGAGLLSSLLGGRRKVVNTDAVEVINSILAVSPVIQNLQWHTDEA